jgi:fatty acid desaturase
LPPEALRPHPWACARIGIHFAIVAACLIASRYVPHIWWPVLGLVIGNSRTALNFLAHDLSHRSSIITNRYLLYPTELVLWSTALFPATLWRRIHAAHHADTNGEDDPERRWLASELSLVGAVTAATLTPNRTLRYNVLWIFYWLTWPYRHGVALLFPGRSKPGFVTAKPHWSTKDRLRIAFEIVVIVAVQIALWKLLQGAYLWVCVMPQVIAAAILSVYFFTNHGLKPIGDGSDVLAATTSVVVPEFCNKLHSYFAYHTEHHLFPSMNPRFYPLVRNQLRRQFPDRYHCIPITEAWAALLQSPIASPRSDETRSRQHAGLSGIRLHEDPVGDRHPGRPRRAAELVGS